MSLYYRDPGFIPLTPEPANLFFELTKPIELKDTNNFPGNFDTKDFVQKS